LGELTL